MIRRFFISLPLAALARARNASAPLEAAREVNGINTSLHPKITYDLKVLNKLSKKFVVRSKITKPGDEVLFL